MAPLLHDWGVPQPRTSSTDAESIDPTSAKSLEMTYIVTVLDRGRPIAKHPSLDLETGREVQAAYRAMGWPEEKIRLEPETGGREERAAA